MAQIETVSKRAALTSLVAIAALQLALHPDMTWALRALGLGAGAAGWLLAGRFPSAIHGTWLLVAPLAPTLLRLVAAREGPVLDLVWMTGLTGSLLRAISWSQWSLPRPWSVLLGGWALVLSLAWPVIVAREAGFRWEGLVDLTTTTSWAEMPAAQVIAWTLVTVQAQLLALCWLEWARGAFAAAAPRLPPVVHWMWIGITLSSVVALVQGTVAIDFLNVPFWIGEQRAPGTMLDANAYGLAAALAAPVGFLAMRTSRSWTAAVSVLVLAANWGGVWMSGSRTGLLCLVCGAAGLAAGLVASPQDLRSRRRLLLAGAAIVLAAGFALAGATTGPLQRLAGIPLDREGVASLWNRGGYGTIAVQMIREYPLAGTGIGAYRYLAPDYWRAMDDNQLVLDNAQNWWRQQVAELGVLGSAPIIVWSLLVAWGVLTAPARPESALTAWTVRSLVFGVGICSLFGIPTQNPLVLIWFFAVVAWMDSLTRAPAGTEEARPRPRGAWVAVAVLAVAYAAAHLLLASGSLSIEARSLRFDREYIEGAYAAEPLPGSNYFTWTDDRARFVIPARGRWLVMRMWAHHPDIGERPVAVRISSPCGVLFERTLQSHEPIGLSIEIPDGIDGIDAEVTVSRTWVPAEGGGGDVRQLGVGVSTDFVEQRMEVVAGDLALEWPRECSE